MAKLSKRAAAIEGKFDKTKTYVLAEATQGLKEPVGQISGIWSLCSGSGWTGHSTEWLV